MNEQELLNAWKAEERAAHIHGWDFSHIAGRYTEETDLPWDYRQIILERLTPEMKLLDVDTGGGEFLLSLRHPYQNTSAARIRRMRSSARRRCARWALTFARAAERTRCRLTTRCLISSSTATAILTCRIFAGC